MKKSKLLAAGVLGTIYLIYLISYFTGAVGSSEGAEALGSGIAAALVTPHIGMQRASFNIGLTNLIYNFCRYSQLKRKETAVG